MNEIVIYRGNNKTVNLTITHSGNTGLAYNLLGCIVTMYVKKNINDIDTDAVISKTGTLVDASNGIVDFYLVPNDTNDVTELKDNVVYPVDFEVLTGTGNLYTALRTSFIIIKK